MNKELEKKLKQIKDYLASKNTVELTKIIEDSHPVDVAEILNNLEREEKVALFNFLKPEEAARILPEVDSNSKKELLESLENSHLSKILEVMSPDEAADILGDLSKERECQILRLMGKEESEDVHRLLKYDDDTAGGIMTSDFLALPGEMKIDETIEWLRKSNIKTISYIYVVDKEGHLSGVLSLQDLIIASPLTQIKEIMNTDIIKVTTDVDQEEVANLVRKYNLRALPVVDLNNILVGKVTVDDVLDVVEEEAREDIYKMAGMEEANGLLHYSIPIVTRMRLPWLIICLIGGLGAAGVIGIFEEAIAAVAVLVAFIPVIMDMGGNIGTQSSTIVIRGLATGNIGLKDGWKLLWRELRIGLLIGAICGIAVGGIAQIWKEEPYLGIVVGVAMMATIVVAAILGVILPILFQRFGVDPAIASGPAITTIKDITGLLIYFGIATLIMGI